jgi:hypothetical protein
MSQPRPFPVDARLTGIALAYTNRELIADAVMPRVPVGNQTFKWLRYNKADRFTIPNTLVGRKGQPNEVEFGATEESGQVFDYGLDDVVPNDDIASAPEGYDPLGNATEGIADLIALDREVRVATAVNTTGNHGGNAAVGGSDKVDDPTSDLLELIMDTLAIPLMRPNTMVTSGAVRDALVRHPQIVKAYHGNDGGAGIVPDAFIAQLFGLRAFLYSRAIKNTAKPGQTMSASQIWSDNIAFLHQNPLANTRRGFTWGYTAQWMNRVAGRLDEPKTGLRGAVRVRVGESVNELVVGTDGSYLLTAALT